MSISRQNLSIVIVTLKSEKVIYDCIKSINHEVPIIVVENSNNNEFKEKIESEYKNVSCILSESNIGMGAGNNIGITAAKTDFVFIINPDVVLQPDTLDKLFLASEQIPDFSILSPISADENFPNYKMIKKDFLKIEKSPLQVDYVDGFAMLLNKKNFRDNIFFDENFFMYLENNDLCLRVKKNGGSIYIVPTAKINHKGSHAVDPIFAKEVELSRNWHWVWSKFYFNKKNFSFIKALKECLPTFMSAILKIIIYSALNKSNKKKIYFNRASGFYNALIGKSSWYRPKIKN